MSGKTNLVILETGRELPRFLLKGARNKLEKDAIDRSVGTFSVILKVMDTILEDVKDISTRNILQN